LTLSATWMIELNCVAFSKNLNFENPDSNLPKYVLVLQYQSLTK